MKTLLFNIFPPGPIDTGYPDVPVVDPYDPVVFNSMKTWVTRSKPQIFIQHKVPGNQPEHEDFYPCVGIVTDIQKDVDGIWAVGQVDDSHVELVEALNWKYVSPGFLTNHRGSDGAVYDIALLEVSLVKNPRFAIGQHPISDLYGLEELKGFHSMNYEGLTLQETVTFPPIPEEPTEEYNMNLADFLKELKESEEFKALVRELVKVEDKAEDEAEAEAEAELEEPESAPEPEPETKEEEDPEKEQLKKELEEARNLIRFNDLRLQAQKIVAEDLKLFPFEGEDSEDLVAAYMNNPDTYEAVMGCLRKFGHQSSPAPSEPTTLSDRKTPKGISNPVKKSEPSYKDIEKYAKDNNVPFNIAMKKLASN